MADSLNTEEFEVDTPAGPVTVRIMDRWYGSDSPKGGTAATVETKPERITPPRPATHDSDNGGPVDQAWKAYNAAGIAEMRLILDAALPAILTRVEGEPGEWTYSRYAMCSVCPCTPGLVAEQRLRRNGRTADIWIYFPNGRGRHSEKD